MKSQKLMKKKNSLSWRFSKKERSYIKEVLDSGFASSTSGNMNTRLENAFAKRFNRNFAITFNSGTTLYMPHWSLSELDMEMKLLLLL